MTDNLLYYLVNPGDNYIYLREVLISHMEISRSLLTKLKLQHKIKVNGQVTYTTSNGILQFLSFSDYR